jgi:hypothetical protein
MRRGALAFALTITVATGIGAAQEAPDADADGIGDGAGSPRAVQPTAPEVLSDGVLAGTLIAVTWSTTDAAVGSIDTATGSWTTIGNTGQTRLNGLARDTGEVFWTVAWDGATSSWLATVDASTGVATIVATVSPSLDVRGLAFDGANTLYAIHNNPSSDDLYTIDTTTGASTLVGPTGYGGVQGLAYSPASGILYAWDVASGLVIVNPATGAGTDVNAAVGGTTDIQTISALPDGSMYGVRYDLYTINPADGSYVVAAVGGYPDVRGADFTGPFPVALQSFTAQ